MNAVSGLESVVRAQRAAHVNAPRPSPALIDRYAASSDGGPVEAPKDVRDALFALNRSGRLFEKREGALHRCSPIEAWRTLHATAPDKHLYLVTAMGRRVAAHQSHDAHFSLQTTSAIIAETIDLEVGDERASTVTERVYYQASPLRDLRDLELADPTGKGITGAAVLPESGGSVTRTLLFEQRWQRFTLHTAGLAGGLAGRSVELAEREEAARVERRFA
jgi:hypothetical protein